MKHEEDDSNEFDVDWSQMEDLVKSDSVEAQALIIDQAVLLRRVLWDTVPCEDAPATAKYLQLSHSSDDVEEMDHHQSHERIQDIAILLPVIYAVADSAARTITAAMAVVSEDTESIPLDGEVYNEQYDAMKVLAYSVSRAVVMELVSFGVVHLPHLRVIGEDEE